MSRERAMDTDELEKISWKFIRHMRDNKLKTYSQVDIMEVCKVNALDAIDISNCLVEMGLCKYE